MVDIDKMWVLVDHHEVGDEERPTVDVDKYREIDDNGLGLAHLIREHEKYMDALARKLKGNGMGITYPFAIVKESKEMSYTKALVESNEGSTVKVGVIFNLDEKTYFDMFCVCFKGLKDGQKIGCRRIISLDGCLLKKPNTGKILTAVGRDGNNYIFPIAWAIMSVENKDNWSWFLDLLADDLELPNGIGLTLMSNQHKGLTEAVKDVMPLVEHQQCARHIYEGFRKQFSGVEFRELFGAALKASYPQQFSKIIEKIQKGKS
nr:pentatricopeptide repeat-containing protein [Tanacetum cinerariifolium]